jgi:hypothetical protein
MEEEEEDQGATQINGGEYTCTYCGECFRELRYRHDGIPRDRGDDPAIFCLPECFTGYEWFVVGRNCESEEERAQTIDEFRRAFNRNVRPSPITVYMRSDPRKRAQWLWQDCRDPLRLEHDRVQATKELRVIKKP